MIHLDVKKADKMPYGGRWRRQCCGQARVAASVGYTYLHSAVDGFSRRAYTEALDNERATTTIGFFRRTRPFCAAHGINRLHRVVTDNGANYRAKNFTRRGETLAGISGPPYPRERARREAIRVWVNHFNYRRPYIACGDQPPASRLPARSNNVMPFYN